MDDIDYGEISYSDEDIDKFVLMSKCLSEIFITKEKYITRINLINRINGNIRNSKRVPQFIKCCSLYHIIYIPALLLTTQNAWFSDFFEK